MGLIVGSKQGATDAKKRPKEIQDLNSNGQAARAISRQQRSGLALVGDVAVFARSSIHIPSPREHVLRAYFMLAVLFMLGGMFWAILIYFLFL